MRLAAAREERALCCAQGSSAEVMPRLHGYRDVEEQQIGERAMPGKLGPLRCCRGEHSQRDPKVWQCPRGGISSCFSPCGTWSRARTQLVSSLGDTGKFNRTWCRWGRNDPNAEISLFHFSLSHRKIVSPVVSWLGHKKTCSGLGEPPQGPC